MAEENASGLIGIEGVLLFGDEGDAFETLTEVGNVKDASFNATKATADMTTRANNGWRENRGTLKEGSITCQIKFLPSDDFFQKVQSAFLQKNELVRLAFLSEEDGEGPLADYSVTDFTWSQALEEGQMVDVTFSLVTFVQWVGSEATDD